MKTKISLAILILAGLLGASVGCGHATPKKPLTGLPVLFRHCEIIQEPDGRKGCDCLHPLIIETVDAQTKKRTRIAYCDGKVN
jgi:hypothetical protein